MKALTRKARRLQELADAGIPVPSTIVLSCEEVERLVAVHANEGIDAAAALLLSQVPHDFFPLALRTSYGIEDDARASFAGAFSSIIGIPFDQRLVSEALRTVLDEYLLVLRQARGSALELVLQPQIKRTVHGVLFTIDPESGSDDYFVISTTDAREDVTAGARSLTAYVDKTSRRTVWGSIHLDPEDLDALLDKSAAIQKLFPESAIDIEFGLLRQKMFFFQVRPVTAVLTKEECWFHSSNISDIAPPYKHVFSRHRAKRHRIYSVFADSGDVHFPRSLVVSKRSLSQRPSLSGRGIRTASVLTAADEVVAPQRKEDFRLVSIADFDGRQCPRSHLLVTEAPDAAFSGHLLVTQDAVMVEWTEGPLSGFNAGSKIRQSPRIAGCSKMLNTQALQALFEGMREHFPGSVAEWIQDHQGRLWIYDATLGASAPMSLPPEEGGLTVQMTAGQITQLGKLRRYPMSVNGEDDYMDDALHAKIVEIVPELGMGRPIMVSSEHPAIELAILSLIADVKEFRVAQGSVLCHLALIAREKGKRFAVGLV